MHTIELNIITTKWNTLVIENTVLSRYTKILVIREQNLCVEKIYRKNLARTLINLIRSLLVENIYANSVQKKLATLNKTTNWTTNHDIFWYQDRLYISITLRFYIIERNYNDSLANYFNIEKILELISKKYYWSNIKSRNSNSNIQNTIKKYCESYTTCKRSKILRHKPYEHARSLLVSKFK